MASSLLEIGSKFTFGTDDTAIIYEIENANASSSPAYYRCKQITSDNERPSTLYLSPDQLNHVTPYTQKERYKIGTEFTMGVDTNTKYTITDINSECKYYKCSQNIYLSFDQFTFVNVAAVQQQEAKEALDEPQQDFEHLSTILPYFTDFMLRKEKSVLNQNDFSDDPSGYLKAIREKYNIKHRRELNMNHDGDGDDEIDDEHYLRPWIEGKMEKLSAESGYFVKEKWQTRLFRLFDEALVWFDDDSFFSKLYRKKRKRKGSESEDENEYMTPFGVLPLAMITGLKTADIDGQITEDELLRLELEVGDEGVIILKCSDVNQRIKWYECLHCAIFAVKRPLFIADKNLWRISEPNPAAEKQITKSDLNNSIKRSSSLQKMRHVKMGKSLAFLTDMKKAFTPVTAHDEDHLDTAFDNINTDADTGSAVELQTKQTHTEQVPSMSHEATVAAAKSDDVKIL